MRMVRVEYTVRTTGSDGKTVSEKKERVLSDLASIDPTYIQEVLEQVVRATEEFGENIPGFSLLVTNITELFPTGDDDQM